MPKKLFKKHIRNVKSSIFIGGRGNFEFEICGRRECAGSHVCNDLANEQRERFLRCSTSLCTSQTGS